MIPTKLVHIVVDPGRVMWDRKIQNIIGNQQRITCQQVLGMNQYLFGRNTKTKMTALARSIDLNRVWTNFDLKTW